MYIYINLHAIMLQSYKKKRYKRPFFTYSLHLDKKKLTLQHCFRFYRAYGTELHLDCIFRGGIRHRTRTADFLRQL